MKLLRTNLIFILLIITTTGISINAQKGENNLIVELKSKYTFTETIERLTSEAKTRSWNIPVVHDLQKSLAKAGKEVKPVTVIEICKPEFSGKLLELNYERIVSVFMPCRISVYEKDDGKTYVALIDGEALAGNQPKMEPVKGRNAIKKQFTISQEQNPKEIMNWNTERVDVASSGDLAVEYGNFDVKNSGPEGNDSDHGTYVTVFRKDQGKWKITADFVNSTKPIKE